MKRSPSLLLFNFILFSTSIFSQISNDVNEEIVEEP
ncbi:MAG: hypothetical protein RL528_359, partial [Bacteroidota bacterium]